MDIESKKSKANATNQQHWGNNIRLPAKYNLKIEMFSGLILLYRSITQSLLQLML